MATTQKLSWTIEELSERLIYVILILLLKC